MARRDEDVFLDEVRRKIARPYGWLTYHTHDSRKSESGFPDIVMVRAPRLVFAELKTNTGLLAPEQRVWHEQLGLCETIESYVWRPIDAQRIADTLKR